MRDYVVPILFRTSNQLIVKAENEAEAIKKVNEIIKSNEQAKLVYDDFKILWSEIECLQDDEILDQVIKEHNLKEKDGFYTHSVAIDGEGMPAHLCTKEDKSYSAFTAGDVVFVMDKKIIGEINSILINSEKKEISLRLCIFNTIAETDCFLKSIENSTFLQVFCNEYEDKIYRSFTGLKFKHEITKMSVEDICLTEEYVFEYSNANPFSTFDCTLKELIEHA